MKKIFFLIIIFYGFNINSQNLTEQEKQRIISNLSITDSSGIDLAYDAVLKVIKYNIEEAVSEIESNFNIQDNYTKEYFLKALNVFKSPNVNLYANAFLDSLNLDEKDDRDFVSAILLIQFENGDISRYQLVLQEVQRDNPILTSTLAYALKYIAKNIPSAKSEAIQGLKRIAREAKNHHYRGYAFDALTEILGKGVIPFLLERIPYENINSPTVDIYRYLSIYKSPLIDKFLKEQLQLEYNIHVYEALLDVMVDNYNTIENYAFIKELFKNNQQKFIKNLFESYLYDSRYFRKPDSTTTMATMLDTLTSYTNQCYGYEWLKDDVYKNELLNKLIEAKNKLTAGDSTGCRTEVVAFQNSVNQVYQDSAGSYPKYVSNEGYKFLYYYASYILDRLPLSFPPNDIDAKEKAKVIKKK